MFSKITTFLTTFAILAHTVLGCCSHHGHAGSDCCAAEVECEHSQQEEIEGHSHSHHCDADQPEDKSCQKKSASQTDAEHALALFAQPAHDDSFCEEGNCQLVFASTAKWTMSLEKSFAETVCDLSSTFSANLSVNATNVTIHDCLATLRSPQMHQVWLI